LIFILKYLIEDQPILSLTIVTIISIWNEIVCEAW